MRYFTIPANLATLAHAASGQEVEVRRLLPCAPPRSVPFATGDHIVCQHVDGSGVTVRNAAGVAVHVPWRYAHCVQVERAESRQPGFKVSAI